MPTLDEVIEGIAATANADFAFVLTRRGRLVTKTAPVDMPDAGRRRLTKLASSLPRDGKEIAQVTLAREQLVPYGGAAPIDVYVAAIDQAVVCVAMASWADKKHVVAAIHAAQASIESLLAAALKRRGPTRRRTNTKSTPPRRGGRVTSSPPARRGRSRPPPKAGLVQLAGSTVVASERMQASPSIKQSEEPPERKDGPVVRPHCASMPDITLGEAPLGRESLAAIEADTPDGWPVEATGPKIQIGVAPLGRESLAAIDEEELEGVPSGRNMASSPDLRVSLASLPDIGETEVRNARDMQIPGSRGADNPARVTLPWVETAADAKRAADAARVARNVAPRVAVRMQSLAEHELNAILDEETANDAMEAMIQEAARQEAARRDARTREELELDEISGTVRLADDTLVDAEEIEPLPQSGPVVISLPDQARAPKRSAPPPNREGNSDEDDESVALWRDAINRMIDSEKRRSVPPAPKGPPLPSGPPRPSSSPSKKTSGTKSSAPKARPSSAPGARSKSGASKKGPARSGGSR